MRLTSPNHSPMHIQACGHSWHCTPALSRTSDFLWSTHMPLTRSHGNTSPTPKMTTESHSSTKNHAPDHTQSPPYAHTSMWTLVALHTSTFPHFSPPLEHPRNIAAALPHAQNGHRMELQHVQPGTKTPTSIHKHAIPHSLASAFCKD
jgi:hypothetical protein